MTCRATTGLTLISLFLIGGGIFLYLGSRDIPPASFGQIVGPAVFPRVLILVLIFLNLILLIRNAFHRRKEFVQLHGLHRTLGVFLLLIAYVFVIAHIGYFYATPLFLSFVFVLLGIRKWLLIISGSLGFSAFIYFVDLLLKISLP